MNMRTFLHGLGLTTLAITLGAAAQDQNPKTGKTHVVLSGPSEPGARLQPRIGAAPKPAFKVNNHTFTLNPKDPGVAAVRAIAPKSIDPATRTQSVKGFYQDKFTDKFIDNKVAASGVIPTNLYVGPYRREFIWWAWHYWALEDRAWWAWNNYAYFDHELWLQWMADQAFANLIQQYDASHKTRVLGFIPAEYATNAPEIIYNDEYIEAVYNPTPTPPSIVVDSTAGVQLSNLLEGTARVFGKKTVTIGSLHDRVRRYQFISLPADFDPTYDIEVKRDGELYVFGPSITPKNEAFGADADKWQPVSNLVIGQGIRVVYQRQVKAGEKIRLHGVEWSIASEQIELFSPASQDAMTAARHVVRDLEQMANNKGDFLQANPSLADYVQEARTPATELVTANNNVNDEVVADCRYELGNLQKMSEADLAQTANPRLASAGMDFVNRVKRLEEILNEVDGLRDPSSQDQMPAQSVLAGDNAANQIRKDFDSLREQSADFIAGRNGMEPHPRFGTEMDKAATDLAGGLSTEAAKQQFLGDLNQAKSHLEHLHNVRGQSDASRKKAGELASAVAALIGEVHDSGTVDLAPSTKAENADNARSSSVAANGGNNLANLLPVGSVWVPAPNSKNPDESLTVLSVDHSKVDFRFRAGNGAIRRWTFEVAADGQLQQTADVPIHVLQGAPEVTDMHIVAKADGKTLTVNGNHRRGGKLAQLKMSLTMQGAGGTGPIAPPSNQ